MSITQLKADLTTAIQQAEHKPGEWSQTAQSMGGICCSGEPFQIGKPWAREEPWANFSYKRDSWLAVAAVNSLPALLEAIDRLEASSLHINNAIAISASADAESLAEQCRALQAENESLRKDAERYRAVRRVANRQGYSDERFDQQTDDRTARFDAAMAEERGQ